MTKALFKLFVVSFYKANASFLLFFYFIFFGTVNGGSLISYHVSLLKSIAGSSQILIGVAFFWLLYETKCLLYLLRIINSDEGGFLYNLQSLPRFQQVLIYAGCQMMLYLPVQSYALVAVVFSLQHGYNASAWYIAAFSVVVNVLGALVIYNRINNWIKTPLRFKVGFGLPKPFVSYPVHHFFTTRKTLLAVLKIFSVTMLYIVSVWNKGKADNDSFLLFYLMIWLAHVSIPFLAVRFVEKELSFVRNLPLHKITYALMYFFCFCLLLLPEVIYLFLYGQTLLTPFEIVAYFGVAVTGLFLLTAVQYCDAMTREEYIKVCFALCFVSIFALHIKAFLFWICIQFFIGAILFWNGFYKYEPVD